MQAIPASPLPRAWNSAWAPRCRGSRATSYIPSPSSPSDGSSSAPSPGSKSADASGKTASESSIPAYSSSSSPSSYSYSEDHEHVLTFGTLGGVEGGLESGLGRYESVGGGGAVLHVPLHLKTFGDHGAKHIAEVFVVDEVAGGEFVDANVGTGLGEDVELRGVEPFGGVGDALFVVRIEVPAEADEKHEGDGAGLDLVAGDATVPLFIGGGGLDDGDLEGGRGRLGKSFGDTGRIGGRSFVNA